MNIFYDKDVNCINHYVDIDNYLTKLLNKEVIFKEYLYSSLLEKPIEKEYSFQLKKAIYGKLTYSKRINQLMVATSLNGIYVVSGIEKVAINHANENLLFIVSDEDNLKNIFEIGLKQGVDKE